MPVTSVITTFAKDLRSLAHIGASASEITKVFRGVKSGFSAFDNIVGAMRVVHDIHGVPRIGGSTLGRVAQLTRAGRLADLAKLSGSAIHVTATQERMFAKMVSHTGEHAIYRMKSLAKSAGNKFKSINFKLSEWGARIKNGITMAKIQRISTRFVKLAKPLTVYSCLIGSIVFTGMWVHKALNDRKGCFMVTEINNKKSSCKIMNFSCLDTVTTQNKCDKMPNFMSDLYNDTLLFMALLRQPRETEDRKRMMLALGYDTDIDAPVKEIMSGEKYIKLVSFFKENKDVVRRVMQYVKICNETHPDVEGGKIPDCRMCDETASPMSTEYINLSNVGTNITFTCVSDPSLLELLTDAAIALGQDIFKILDDGIISPIMDIIKHHAYNAIAILAGFLGIAGIVWYFFTRLKGGGGGGSKDTAKRKYDDDDDDDEDDDSDDSDSEEEKRERFKLWHRFKKKVKRPTSAKYTKLHNDDDATASDSMETDQYFTKKVQ